MNYGLLPYFYTIMSNLERNEVLSETGVLVRKFADFWSQNGFVFEENNSAIPDDTHPDVDFLACNAMAFTPLYTGEETVVPERQKLARLQSSVRPGGGRKIGISAKHMTGFDMLGVFDFECCDPQALLQKVVHFFATELGIGYECLSINVSKGTVFDSAARNIQSGNPDFSIREMPPETLQWNAVAGKQGFRAEINCKLPSGSEWELWNVSYVDGRIFDSGGSLERLLAVTQNKESVFDVGELADIRAQLEPLVAACEPDIINFLCDKIRVLKRLQDNGVTPGGRGGRQKFVRNLAQDVISTLLSIGGDPQNIFKVFGLDEFNEVENFDRKIRQAEALYRRNPSLFGNPISLRTLLSESFIDENITQLNLLKYPHALVSLLIEMGACFDLQDFDAVDELLSSQLPLVFSRLIKSKKTGALINNVRSDIKQIDPKAGIILTGSKANSRILNVGDVDLIVVSDTGDFASRAAAEIDGYCSTDDDSLRFQINSITVGILPLSIRELENRINGVLDGSDLKPRYKNWAVGAEVPEGFLGDIDRAKVLVDRPDGAITNLRRQISTNAVPMYQEIEKHCINELNLRMEQLNRQVQIGAEGEYGLALVSSQILFILIRLAYARQKNHFRGVKRVNEKILVQEPQIYELIKRLANGDHDIDEINVLFRLIGL